MPPGDRQDTDKAELETDGGFVTENTQQNEHQNQKRASQWKRRASCVLQRIHKLTHSLLFTPKRQGNMLLQYMPDTRCG